MSSAKPALLLLSGFLFKQSVWLPLSKQLREDFNCMLWDMSDIKNDSLCQVTDHIVSQLPETFYLCGWSMGGSLALYIALKYPNRVQGLLMVATNPCFIANQNWPGVEIQNLNELLALFKTEQNKAIEQFLILSLLGTHNRQDIFKILRLNIMCDMTESVLTFCFEKLLMLDLSSQLKTLTVPAKFIFFKKDRLIPWQVSHQINRYQNPMISVSVIPNTGHGSLVMNYHFIADRLRSLL